MDLPCLRVSICLSPSLSASILVVDDSERLLGRKEARLPVAVLKNAELGAEIREEAYYLTKSPKPDERMLGRQQISLLSHHPKQYTGRREMIKRGDERWRRRVTDGEEKEGRLRARNLFTFVRGVMARAYVVNGATID